MPPMEINVPIILPNLLFESFHEHFPVKFQACRGAGLRSFWDSVNPDDPRLVDNPMVEVDNWKDKFFPVTVHGDGARFNMRGNSLMVVSMSFLLLHGWSLDSIFLLWVWPKNCRVYQAVHGKDTHTEFWLYLAQAFNALMDGVHPEKIHTAMSGPQALLQQRLQGKK